MTNTQIDKDKLRKKLAEWTGWTYDKGAEHYEGDRYLRYGLWYSPDGNTKGHTHSPNFPESIDTCIKWLVPQALKLLAKKGYIPPIMKLFQLWYDELVTLTGDSSNTNEAALALCLAIEKLIDGKQSKL